MWQLKIKKNVLKCHICLSIQTLYSVLVEAPMAAITASSLLEYDATSLAHLYLGSFCHSSLQILSSSVRLDEDRHCLAIFRSFQRCSIWFKSRLWLGHSRTFRDFGLSPRTLQLLQMHNQEHPVGLYRRLVRQLLCPQQ